MNKEEASTFELIASYIIVNGSGLLGLFLMLFAIFPFKLLGFILFVGFLYGWFRAFEGHLPWRDCD